MSFRKFRADHIFNGYELLESDHILVTSENGEVIDLVKESSADSEYYPGIISPGFINAHCHLELSHMKGLIPEKTGLVDFVYRVVNERNFPEGDIQEAIHLAESEMLSDGVIAVGDICNNLTTLKQKLKRNLDYHNFVEVSGWLPQVAEARFNRSKVFYDAFKIGFPRTSLTPHASYSVSNPLWELLKPYITGNVVSIHNQETLAEDEFFRYGKGDLARMYQMMSIDISFFKAPGSGSLLFYLSKLSSASSLIFVHNTFTTESDVGHILESAEPDQRVSFCICINANIYIEDKIPPVEMLLKNGCSLVLGTDSLASNHSLSILDEMKTVRKHFVSIELEDMLRWATLNGAKALQMESVYGSFEKGKMPGVVLIEGLEGGELCDGSRVRRLL